MKEIVTVSNQNSVDKILRSLIGIVSQINTSVKVVIDPEFYKIYYKDIKGEKCSFSIWIEKNNGEHVFLNIGSIEKETTVYHYADITSEIVVQDIVDFISFFSRSLVVEKSIICGERLKRVNYIVFGESRTDENSFLNESCLFCLKKKVTEVKYEKWVSS